MLVEGVVGLPKGSVASFFRPATLQNRFAGGDSRPSENAVNDSFDKPSQKPSRDISMTEFYVANAVGVVGSLAAGFATGNPLLGVLGMFVAPIPVIVGYVAARRIAGDSVNYPLIRFAPGFHWAGRRNKD